MKMGIFFLDKDHHPLGIPIAPSHAYHTTTVDNGNVYTGITIVEHSLVVHR